MKKLLTLFCLTALFCLTLTLSACGLFGSDDDGEADEVHIATASELLAIGDTSVKKDTVYILDNDIDFNGAPVSTISGNASYAYLDGNGYTIKNIVVTGSTNCMFYGFKSVSNLNFEGVQINTTSNTFGLVFTDVSNCTVKDVTAVATPSGSQGLVFGILAYSTASVNATNCTVEDAEINITLSNGSVYAGALAGSIASAADCSVKDVKISVTDTHTGGTAEIGGMCGTIAAGEKLSAENVSISITAEGSSTYYAVKPYAGGLCGMATGNLSRCCVDGINITGTCHGGRGLDTNKGFAVGGIAGALTDSGSISNCYSLNVTTNTNVTGSVVVGTSAYKYLISGGIVGYLEGSVNYCYSYNFRASGSSVWGYFVGGICGYMKSGSALYCAALDLSKGTLTCEKTSDGAQTMVTYIAYYDSGTVTNCYYYNSASANGMGEKVESYDLTLFTDSLKFTSAYWDFSQFDSAEVEYPLPVLSD